MISSITLTEENEPKMNKSVLPLKSINLNQSEVTTIQPKKTDFTKKGKELK